DSASVEPYEPRVAPFIWGRPIWIGRDKRQVAPFVDAERRKRVGPAAQLIEDDEELPAEVETRPVCAGRRQFGMGLPHRVELGPRVEHHHSLARTLVRSQANVAAAVSPLVLWNEIPHPVFLHAVPVDARHPTFPSGSVVNQRRRLAPRTLTTSQMKRSCLK